MPPEEFEPALSALEQQQIFRSYYHVIKDNGMLLNTHETTWNSWGNTRNDKFMFLILSSLVGPSGRAV